MHKSIILPLKRHREFAADNKFKFCCFNKYGMLFHENLLADDSHTKIPGVQDFPVMFTNVYRHRLDKEKTILIFSYP